MDSRELLSDRAPLYALLARLFTYPLEADALTAVTRLSLDDDAIESSLSAALAQMKAALLGGPSVVETLNREATRLFEGPGQPVAPPFGSFYLNGRRLMGPEAVDVRQAYLAAQLLPDRDGGLPPDHLSLELGFLAALAQGGSPNVTTFREFLAKHMLNWLPKWRADVQAAQAHPFFAGLAAFTQAALEADRDWLSDNDSLLAPEMAGALEDVK
jgi:TorA maturation chaperone TorD